VTEWLPDGFVHPDRLELPTGHHLRPIRAADVDLDYPAVMGSRERLWAKFGAAWGWPPATMTLEEDRRDLARHEDENARHLSFCYAVFDEAETALLGCVYLDPPPADGASHRDTEAGAIVSSWVVDTEAGGPLENALDTEVPRWLAERWLFRSVRYGV